jgi:hypothetical protein
MNTSIPGNMTTVKHMGIISDDCNDFNWLTIIMINDI